MDCSDDDPRTPGRERKGVTYKVSDKVYDKIVLYLYVLRLQSLVSLLYFILYDEETTRPTIM